MMGTIAPLFANFDAIEQQARRNFECYTMPAILNNLVNITNGNSRLGSPSLQRIILQARQEFEQNLAIMRQRYELQQQIQQQQLKALLAQAENASKISEKEKKKTEKKTKKKNKKK